MKTHIHVWPIGDQWAVSEFTLWQGFMNDWAHFGFRVALFNVLCLLGICKPTESVE